MKDKGYKIGKEISDRLDTLARGLPVIAQMNGDGQVVTRKVEVVGQKLLDDGYLPKAGESIDPRTMYRVNRIMYVNHRQQLDRAFKQDGEAGIIKYLDYVKTLKSAASVQMEKKLAGKNWFKQTWLKVKYLFVKPKIQIGK